jgi:ADP-heptose:LPS heptosyltransferase
MTTIYSTNYVNGMAMIKGTMVTFKEGVANVPDDIAKFLMSRSGYSLHPTMKCLGAKKILVIRNQGLGDVLFCTVVPKFLKKINPESHITFATFPRNFRALEGNPNIDNIISCENINNDGYDYTCNLNNFFEIGSITAKANILHRVTMLRTIFECLPQISEWDNNIFYQVSDDDKIYAKNILKPYINKKIIAFFPQSSELTRRYPDSLGLVKFLADKGYLIIIISPGGEKLPEHKNILNMAGKTDLSQMGSLIDAADLIITPDSGPLHLAGALDKKIITFFNSFPPHTRTQFYKKCFAFTAEGKCPYNKYPCSYGKCPATCFKKITFEDFFHKSVEMIGYP